MDGRHLESTMQLRMGSKNMLPLDPFAELDPIYLNPIDSSGTLSEEYPQPKNPNVNERIESSDEEFELDVDDGNAYDLFENLSD